MTVVYAESPFILQLALRQDQVAAWEKLLTKAIAGTLTLAIPAACWVEAYVAWRERRDRWLSLSKALQTQSDDLGRTDSVERKVVAAQLREAGVPISKYADNDRADIESTVSRVATICRDVPVRGTLIHEARRLQATYGIEVLDSLMAAHVLDDASREGTPRAFLCLDKALGKSLGTEAARVGLDLVADADELRRWLAGQEIDLDS